MDIEYYYIRTNNKVSIFKYEFNRVQLGNHFFNISLNIVQNKISYG